MRENPGCKREEQSNSELLSCWGKGQNSALNAEWSRYGLTKPHRLAWYGKVQKRRNEMSTLKKRVHMGVHIM